MTKAFKSKSVLDEIVRTYEIVFVNDGSMDATIDHLNALASKDSRVLVIDQLHEPHAYKDT